MNSPIAENTSGQGASASVPNEIRGWNWGAFLLTWIWGIGNNVLLALLTLVPFVGLVMWVLLGVKGSEWAWQQKRWDSVEHFRRVQRTWAKWGVIVLLASSVFAVVCVTVLFFGISSVLKSSEPYRDAVDHLHANTIAMATLGEPVSTGLPRGSMSTSDGEAVANLDIAVTGTKRSGTLHIEGSGHGGHWRYQRIDLDVGGQRTDLNPEAAGSGVGQ